MIRRVEEAQGAIRGLADEMGALADDMARTVFHARASQRQEGA
jgi:hypothetical protein